MTTETQTGNGTSYITTRFDQALNVALVEVGERFGLYSVLATIGAATTQEVVENTGIGFAQVDHWLHDQAAAGYLDYDRPTARFSLWCEIGRN